MRIAISCFAFPDFGRPTRRARLSSSSVDSGISEKSIRSSRIGFALFRARTARGDDTKCFFAIFHSPIGINQDEYPTLTGNPQSLESILRVGVFQVFTLEGIRIGKNGGRFLERDAVLPKIPGGFSGVPGERIYVYTIISLGMSRKLDPYDSLTSILTGSIRISDAGPRHGSRDRSHAPSERTNENRA